MSIITYPLNGVTYGAEDVSTYLCTRTSGIYAKESNFEINVTGTREITVSPGLAWINYDDFCGVSVCSREDTVLTVPAADSTLTRIDRVVLQFDVDANATVLKLKTGTPSAAPEPPAIQQNHSQYELGLYTIKVPGGSAAVTSADLTDTRLDEELCGIMRDGVTGIPTDQLLQQAQARLDELETPADEFVKDISLSGNTLTLTRGNGQTESFELAEGYTLPAATYSTLGGIKVGTNLSITTAGVLSAIDGASIVAKSIGDSISYIRLSNGVQICWGFTSYQYITFPVPFVNDNSVGFASHASYSGSSRLVTATKSILSTNFLDWIAIGLWK